MRFTGFIGPSYLKRSPNVDAQRCVNLYPEANESGDSKEREPMALFGTPGLNLQCTLASGPVRGIYTSSFGVVYAVGGNILYQVNSDFSTTVLGTLNTATGSVSMADNGLQLFVVDGPNGYYWTFGDSTFTVVTDPAFLGANFVTYQDGYFIFNQPSSGNFYLSGLLATTFDALDFGSSSGNPNNLISIVSINRNLWLLGQYTTAIFYNTGAEDFPFAQIEGGFMSIGIAAPFSLTKMGVYLFWLGQGFEGPGIVYMANGYTPQRISTHAVEQAIQSYSTISDATAFCYQDEGHGFYQLNFPTANATWVFDLATNLWHERAYTNDGVLERHRADCYAFGYGKRLVGDYANGNIYDLSNTTYTDNGAYITRKRVAPHVSNDGNRVFISELRLDIESGVGLDGIQQGTDPQIMMRFSDDGGHSWSNEKWVSMGKIGQKRWRANWRRLGASRDRLFDVTITEPVKIVIVGADIFLEPGAA